MPHITDPNEPYFKDGAWGWDGTVWRKLALVFGFSERYAERAFTLNAGAPSETIATSAVGDGEIWRVEAIGAFNNTRAGASIEFTVRGAGITVPLFRDTTPVQSVYSYWTGLVTLAKDDRIYASFGGTVAGDDLYLDVWGYKMLIAE